MTRRGGGRGARRRLILGALCAGIAGGAGRAESFFGRPPPDPSAPPLLVQTAPRIAGSWRVLPLPEAPLAGEIVFYDRQFEGRAGCGRLFGAYDRIDPWFRVRDSHLEGRCELEAELLERLTRAGRLAKQGAVLEFSDSEGRVLLRLSPR